MKWSIFDSKNNTTLDDVRSKYSVSSARLDELRAAMESVKSSLAKHERTDAAVSQRHEAEVALRNAVSGSHFYSRKEVLQALNQGPLKTTVVDLMQKGLLFAYVDEVSTKVGAIKVYAIKKDRLGRIKLLAATPNNPQEAVSSGLYSVSIVDSENRFFARLLKSRSNQGRVASVFGSRKTQKPRIHFESEIKVECSI